MVCSLYLAVVPSQSIGTPDSLVNPELDTSIDHAEPYSLLASKVHELHAFT